MPNYPTNECTTETTYPPAGGSTVCTTCTGQPYEPSYPAHYDQVPVLGWTAGANSGDGFGGRKSIAGDMHVAGITVGLTGGIVIGFAAPERDQVTDPSNIKFGWYARYMNGSRIAQPIENGVLQGSPQGLSTSDTLEIRRIGTVVTYWVSGTLSFTSTAVSVGAMLVGCALYASGDSVT